MKSLSIVVPAFNASSHIQQCLDSIVESGRLQDLDVIVINDGSVDDTESLIKPYLEKYPETFRLFNKENGGVGSAINLAISEAKAPWFKVLDSDDRLIKDGFVNLLDDLPILDEMKNRPEMIVTNFHYELNKKAEDETVKKERVLADFTNVFLEPGISSWSRLKKFELEQILSKHCIFYSMDLLRKVGLRLPEHINYVDHIFAYEPLPHVRRLYFFDEPVNIYQLGRGKQSCNMVVMQSRLKELLSMALEMFRRIRIDSVRPQRLQTYMYNHMAQVLATLLILVSADEEGDVDASKKMEVIWAEFAKINPLASKKLKKMPMMNAKRLIKASRTYVHYNVYNLIGKVFIL